MARKRRCTKADRERRTRRTSHSSFVLRGYEEKKKKNSKECMHVLFFQGTIELSQLLMLQELKLPSMSCRKEITRLKTFFQAFSKPV